MDVFEFFSNYRNHPVLFVGAGLSLRYLDGSYTWDGLLKKVAFDLMENEEYYLDLKAKSIISYNKKIDFKKLADILEEDFNGVLERDRSGKFKRVNDEYYENMKNEVHLSRLKIYISHLLEVLSYKDIYSVELDLFRKIRKNIACVITTNYDKMIEDIFEFNPLIGNSILLSNPYGSVYKIHGCISSIDKIILTTEDYDDFDGKYELIRAQLLSLFIHNPIVFFGYSVSDDNIKNILKTIYSYVDPNSEQAKKIESNFLLVEYEKGSTSLDVMNHDIQMEGYSLIRINKVKTDDYASIYKGIADLSLPISAMDIRKVQDVIREIMAGGAVKVTITDDLDSLSNSDKVLAIGASDNIRYEYKDHSSMIGDYFKTISDENMQIVQLINKMKIIKNLWFPVYGFSKIYDGINDVENMKVRQLEKITNILSRVNKKCHKQHDNISNIINDMDIATTYKTDAIAYYCFHSQVELQDLKSFLYDFPDKRDGNYRKLLCVYDYLTYR